MPVDLLAWIELFFCKLIYKINSLFSSFSCNVHLLLGFRILFAIFAFPLETSFSAFEIFECWSCFFNKFYVVLYLDDVKIGVFDKYPKRGSGSMPNIWN